MDTILFEPLDDAPTPPPALDGATPLGVRAFGFAEPFDGHGFTTLGIAQHNVGGAIEAPVYGIGLTALGIGTVYSFAPAVMPDAESDTRLGARAFGSFSLEYSDTRLGFSAFGTGSAPDDVLPPPVYAEGDVSVEDVLSFASTPIDLVIAVTRELARLGSQPGARATASLELLTALRLGSAVAVIYPILVEENFLLGSAGSFDYVALERVLARLLASAEPTSLTEALGAIASALVLTDRVDMFAFESLLDALALADVSIDTFQVVGQVLELLMLSAASAPTHTGMLLLSDEIELSGAVTSEAEMASLLQAAIAFRVTLTVDNGQYTAWVMNTVSKGLTTYGNYPFNSFVKLGGRYYGADSTGIHRLDGDDDNGDAIAAKIRLGLNELQGRLLKRVPEVYVGYSSTGTLLLKVITVNEKTGAKQAAHYRLPPKGAQNIREGRFEPGKGLKSVDWDFEVENVDGADFELDSIQFTPVPTSRMTRS